MGYEAHGDFSESFGRQNGFCSFSDISPPNSIYIQGGTNRNLFDNCISIFSTGGIDFLSLCSSFRMKMDVCSSRFCILHSVLLLCHKIPLRLLFRFHHAKRQSSDIIHLPDWQQLLRTPLMLNPSLVQLPQPQGKKALLGPP